MTLIPSFHGYVATPRDAALLIVAAADPNFSLVTPMIDRLSLQDRATISSGCVFVWNERDSGMKRWTDGKRWSKSRVEGLFLIYKQLEAETAEPTIKPNHSVPPNLLRPTSPVDLLQQETSSESLQARVNTPLVSTPASNHIASPNIRDSLKPELMEGFPKKLKIEDNPEALCKKTFAISLNGNICYFTKSEVNNHILQTPSNLLPFKSIKIPATLLTPDNFRLHSKTVQVPSSDEPEDLFKKNFVVIQRTGQTQLLRIFLSEKFMEFKRVVRHAFSFGEQDITMMLGEVQIENQEAFETIKAGDLIQIDNTAPIVKVQIPTPTAPVIDLTNEAALVLMGMIRSKVPLSSVSSIPMMPCNSGSTNFGDQKLQPPALVEEEGEGSGGYGHTDKKVKKMIGR